MSPKKYYDASSDNFRVGKLLIRGRKQMILEHSNKPATQEQMADFLGIGLSTYKSYEAGRSELKLGVRNRFLQITGVDPFDTTHSGPVQSEADDQDMVTQINLRDRKKRRIKSFSIPWWRSKISDSRKRSTYEFGWIRKSRDFIFFTAFFYFTLKWLAIQNDFSFGPSHGEVDLGFLLSFVVFVVLAAPIIQDVYCLFFKSLGKNASRRITYFIRKSAR